MNLYQAITHIQQHLEQASLQSGDISKHIEAQYLINLIHLLRPKNPQDAQEISQKLDEFIQLVLQTPTASYTLSHYIGLLLKKYRQSQLYTDMGIFSQDGFLNQLSKRIGAKLLPTIPDPSHLNFLIEHIFFLESDSEWLEKVTDLQWVQLFSLFHLPKEITSHTQNELVYAITVLSYKISGLSLYPEFNRALPELSEHASPFLVQNKEILDFLEVYQKFVQQDKNQVTVLIPPDSDQALVILEQCNELVQKVRRSTKRIGVSFSLTYLLTLMDQCLERISLLIRIISNEHTHRFVALGHLIQDLSLAHHQEKSIRSLLTTTSELIAFQVTENARRTGEHYVSSHRQDLFQMYKRAAGAGLIIAVMATIKTLMGRLVIAPFMQAMMFSLNYSLGFVAIHLLHFTVATKQPAATAAALAATVQQSKGSKNTQLAELSALIVNIIRTQTWAILGNISIAIPVAAVISLGWELIFSEQLMNYAKAADQLHDLNPFTSLAIPHAAIAGVCLFLSGLIAGYFDNLAIYQKIAPRLKADNRLLERLGYERLNKYADYIESNLGALLGNFCFGIMLGSIGTIGVILGLPLDIRHIAFASANFIQGLLNLSHTPEIGLVLISFLGVLLIGLTNLAVSFSLTIIVALRARRVRFEQWKPLAKLVFTHFVTYPTDFFWTNKSSQQNDDQNNKDKTS